MGGYGSTRWGWRNTRATVESCRRFTVRQVLLHEPGALHGYVMGSLSWTRGDEPSGNITYRVHYSNGQPQRLQLTYTITNTDSGAKVDIDYSMPIVNTLTPWGKPRYWLLCAGCGRRCRTLYMPPSGQRFTCRLCGDLTYTTCQESHKANILAQLLWPEIIEQFPYLTRAEIATLLDSELFDKKPPPRRIMNKINAYYAANPWQPNYSDLTDPYADYLTPAVICERSGLSLADLATLKDARLLVPDHGDLYRPKLGGWAVKLAYLLRAGWSIAEVKGWVRGRWSTPDPRRWPPRMDRFSEDKWT